MPEETEDFIHIPIRDKGQFEEKSFRTITMSASKGIKAVIGKLKGEDSTTVQKYLFAKAKGWTMAKAKKWVKEHKKKAVANIGKIDFVARFTSSMDCLDTNDVTSLKELERLGIEIEKGGLYTRGIIHIDQINRNSWRTGIKEMDTENYMKTPITLYNHNMDKPTGKTVYLKKHKDRIEAITHITTTDEELRENIRNGTINAHSIAIWPTAYERVCLENDACFWDIMWCELLEISHVTVNANVGTNFKVMNASYNPIGEIRDNSTGWYSTAGGAPMITNVIFDGTETISDWTSMGTTAGGGWNFVPTIPVSTDSNLESKETWVCECINKKCDYKIKTSKHCDKLKCPKCGSKLRRKGRPGPGKEKINVTESIDENDAVISNENESMVKTMEDETSEIPKTEEKAKVKGEDLSSTEERFSKLEAKLGEVEKVKAELEAEKQKVNEQSLNLLVEGTMALFEGVENKSTIEERITTIAKLGGKDALEATKAILKSVMESKVVTDESLTPSGGEGMNDLDKKSVEDFGKPIKEIVADIAGTPIIHEIKVEG